MAMTYTWSNFEKLAEHFRGLSKEAQRRQVGATKVIDGKLLGREAYAFQLVADVMEASYFLEPLAEARITRQPGVPSVAPARRQTDLPERNSSLPPVEQGAVVTPFPGEWGPRPAAQSGTSLELLIAITGRYAKKVQLGAAECPFQIRQVEEAARAEMVAELRAAGLGDALDLDGQEGQG